MLKSIKEISNIASYKNYIKDDNLQDFKRYNLFYGWNGSGKSTLARILRTLETKDINKINVNSNFKIEYNDNDNDNIKIIDKNNLIDFKNKIFVFNDEFIKSNIDFGNSLKTNTLTFSENLINEKKELEKIESILNGTNGLYEQSKELKSLISKIDKDLEESLTKTARHIKEHITDYGSKNYITYNKTNLKSQINHNEDKGEVKLKEFVKNNTLTEESRKESISLIKDEIKEEVENLKKLNLIEINSILDEININLKKEIMNTSIENLSNNLELSNWIKEGLKLHEESQDKCLFCDSELTDIRIEELSMHFNEEFKELNKSIDEQIIYIEDLKDVIQKNQIKESDFYNKFNIQNYTLELEDKIKKLSELLEILIEDLKVKQSEIFNINIKYKSNVEELKNYIKNYNDFINEISNIIEENNKITKEFDKKKKEHELKIEIYFIVKYLKDFNYEENLIELKNKEKEFKRLEDKIKQLETKQNEIKEELSNTKIGEEKFNEILSSFLGHDHIYLKYNLKTKYYEILRKENNDLAKNLSEGEKTSIALSYFLIKIQENDNEIKDSIIVIDDPISSFDSNKVFFTYSVIKNICEDAKQLFILTHNFSFYELVLDWFLKENIKVRLSKTDDCKTCKYKETIKNHSIYKIEYSIEENEKNSYISNAGKVLRNGSEYDHLFYDLYKVKDETFSIEKHSSCANVSRRLLESFLSFKYPKQRGELQGLLNMAKRDLILIKEDINWEIKLDEIYKFVNVYSHNLGVNGISSSRLEILSGLNTKIINDVLEILKLLDEKHYNSLADWAEDELKEAIY